MPEGIGYGKKAKKVFHELKKNPPAAVKRTLLTKGKDAARKQTIAIAASKLKREKK